MKQFLSGRQYTVFGVYFGAAALLLGFGPLVGQDDIIKLFVGVGLASAYVAGTCNGRLTLGRPANQSQRPPQPVRVRGNASLSEDQGGQVNGTERGVANGANFVAKTAEQQPARFDF